ncbi:zinc ribbon domain-containing protein [Halorubrum salsamenti]|jgi:predicted nucleic-acid-binding Zn-ribbon protein|uniref:zinc ribbon domain-containing protein n=1 Tax=Halorubrum salsamenti TaxID=2583990 RepID=UPI0011A84AB0|nr:zinc ribbon domain-containing protein [Halorubrum salsamenti]
MPSDNDDETEYSVFGNEASDEWDDAGDDGRADPDSARTRDRPESLAAGDDDGCPKCGHEETETDEIATSGTGLTKMFDVQNRKFVVVSCANCGYSELYKGQSKGNAIDFFIG